MKSSSEIEEICRRYGIKNYTINDDRSIDVDGNVNLMGKGLTELPLTFNRVTGDFSCSRNMLRSLERSPKYVGSGFYCSDNNLTSLEFSPKEVGGYFNCSNNNLTSLENCPKEVGGDFYCSDNPKLTNLEGSPKTVGGDFICYNNNLTSLEFGPIEVGGNFDCYNNPKLTNLYGISDNIGGEFYCDDTPIGSIFNEVDIYFIRAFNVYRVIKDGKVVLKRLKYVMELFNMKYDLEKIKDFYEIN